jgi:hypothetical protein
MQNYDVKPERQRSLGSLIHMWENNIKIVMKEICFEVMNWVNLCQDRKQWLDVANIL